MPIVVTMVTFLLLETEPIYQKYDSIEESIALEAFFRFCSLPAPGPLMFGNNPLFPSVPGMSKKRFDQEGMEWLKLLFEVVYGVLVSAFYIAREILALVAPKPGKSLAGMHVLVSFDNIANRRWSRILIAWAIVDVIHNCRHSLFEGSPHSSG